MDDVRAGSVHRTIVAAASLFALDQIFKAIWISSSGSAELISVQTMVLSITAAAFLYPLGRSTHPDNQTTDDVDQNSGPSASAGWLRFVILAFLATIVVSSLFGFSAFARHVIERTVFVGLLFGYLFLIRSFLQSWILIAVERIIFGTVRIAPEHNDIIGFWTRVSVDTLLIVAATPIGIYALGVDWPEIKALGLMAIGEVSFGALRLSPINFVYALLIFAVLLILTRFVQRLLDKSILPNTRLNPGVRYSLRALIGYAGLLIAAFVGISTLGFDLSNLAIIAGALSVGIGFGLQSVVNNFVSGLILLFERPIKIGDWVVTPSGEGYVKSISVRSTEIETFDRCSVILPNSELISSTVQNWTHRDKTIRVIIPIGVAYQTDAKKARDVLIECAKNHPEVLDYPEPYVYFAGFGDSSLDLELRAFIRNADKALSVRNDLRFEVLDAFRQASITIPFPQRDVHLKGQVVSTDSHQAA